MSHSEMKKNLHNLRQTLRQKENALKEAKTYLENRESLQAAINSLSHQLSQQRRSPDTITQHDRETLLKLKQRKQEIDHWLDSVEDLSEDLLILERKSLIESILQSSPDQQASYHSLIEEKEKLETLIHLTDALLAISQDLDQYLNKIIAEGQSMRRGGFFRYIMGLNPNLVVLSCFTAIKTSSEQALDLIQNSPPHAFSEEEAAQCIQTLNLLHTACQSKWRWRTLPREFQNLKELWLNQKIMLENKKSNYFSDLIKNEQKFNSWLFDL